MCSNNLFLYNFIKHKKLQVIKLKKNLTFIQKEYIDKNLSCIFLYNFTHNNKLISHIKDQKIITVGFIGCYNHPKNTDYTLLLEGKFFSSIFLFHFILKKLINHVKN